MLGVQSLAGEVVKSKSPAEFFADNQNIAGFDNVSCAASTKNININSWVLECLVFGAWEGGGVHTRQTRRRPWYVAVLV